MKRFLTIFLSATLMLSTACSIGGGGEDASGGTGVEQSVMQTLGTEEYQVTTPKAWNVIKKSDFTSDIPGNAEAVFQANRKNEVFLTNVNIVKNNLSQTLSSLDYGKIVIANQKNTLQNYVEKNREEFDTTIKGNKQRIVFVKFEGKRTTTDPLLTFAQAYFVNDRTAYVITGAYANSEDPDVQKEADAIVRSFSIK